MCLPLLRTMYVLPLYMHTYDYNVTATAHRPLYLACTVCLGGVAQFTAEPVVLSLKELGDSESPPLSVNPYPRLSIELGKYSVRCMPWQPGGSGLFATKSYSPLYAPISL